MASEPIDELVFGLADLSDLRHLVKSRAMDSGLSTRRATDLAFAFNEIATNAIVHGRPPASVRIWTGDGEIVCEVADTGGGINDPAAGRVAPSPEAPGGRGLWMARQLCDRLEIRDAIGCRVSLEASVDRPVTSARSLVSAD